MTASNVFYKILFLLIAALVVVGCDSTDDEEPAADAERFVGNWVVVSAADQDGVRDQTPVFADLGELTVDLSENQDFVLALNYTDPMTDDLMLSGPYSLTESSNTLALTVTASGITVDLPFQYMFINDDTVELTTNGATIGLLLNTPLEGDVVLTLERV